MAITDDDLSDSDDSVNGIDAAVVPLTGRQRLERLRSLLGRFDWGLKMERRVLFGKFKTLIFGWTDHLPDLRDFFARDQIDWMLADFVLDYDIETLPFLEFVHATGYRDAPDLNEAGEPTRLRRTTALHLVLDQEPRLRKDIALKLFKIYDSHDANYEDKFGTTHFHVACETGCADIVEKFLDLGQDPDLPESKTGQTPLQLAVLAKHRDVVEALLDHGADPNLADKSGRTLLHSACTLAQSDGLEVAAIIDTIFEICTERRRSISIDALDKCERTALHFALLAGQRAIVEALLRWGADPNRTCRDASANTMTYLHVICRIKGGDDLMAELFLETIEDIGRRVPIDARDNLGWTPLHYAVYYGKRRTMESLLRWGADPNARISSRGLAPVHLLAHRKTEDDLAETFFRMIDDVRATVQLDVKDKSRWTPLQLAVMYRLPRMVETLLARGANLAKFVFPNVISFKKVDFQEKGLKLREAARTMQVVQRLESKGFEVKRRHVVTIMSFFLHYLSLDTSQRLESWHDDEEFASLAREIAIRPSLTLYDLTRSRMPRVEPALTYEDYSKLAEAEKFGRLAEEHVEACTTHLCEMMSADFFRRWALDPFGGSRTTTTTTTNGSAPSRRNHSEGEERHDAQVLPSPSKKRRC